MRTSTWRRVRWAGSLALLGAACGGGGGGGGAVPAEPSHEPPAARADGDATAGAPQDDRPAAGPPWELPDAFRVVVPKAPGGAVDDPTGGLPRLIAHRATGIELLLIAPGSFELGSDAAEPGHGDDEAPARRVDVPAFFLARTETTSAQWKAGGGERGRALGNDHPVTEVSWDQATAWCAANGLLLPTEIEWEYAASGPDDRAFPWGDEANDLAVNARGTNAGDRWDLTAPVGSLPAGRAWCGAYDLAGNVSEWCRDAWTPDHASAADERLRVVRGGSYTCRPPWCLRTAYRDGIEPGLQSPNLGFRAVLEIKP
jgi:hypothetical protein